MSELIARVLLPLPLQPYYSYRLPANAKREPAVGKRVLVPFGKSKVYSGVIRSLEAVRDPQQLKSLKFIDEVVDDEPVVTETLLALYDWIGDYYLCSVGEVLKASLPANLKMESEMVVIPAPDLDLTNPDISDREYLILEALAMHQQLTMREVAEILDLKHPREFAKKLVAKGFAVLVGKVDNPYKAKTVRCLSLDESLRQTAALDAAFEQLKRSPKQSDVLALVAEAFFKNKLVEEKEAMDKAGVSPAITRALRERGLIQIVEIPIDRLGDIAYRRNYKAIEFTEEQTNALALIRNNFRSPKMKPVLLHGVTGSGKTHIYIELIRDALKAGKQSLYLLPEIGLTKQIIDKVCSEFGEAVGVYHSRFNDNERVEIWQKVLNGDYQVVIGVRSSMLLPFKALGLIIVDEEHDRSFKEHDRSPRYNARDVAVYYGQIHNIPVVLGSATPAVESYANALEGKYMLVEIKHRAVEAKLPQIEMVDMKQQIQHKLSHGLFSETLLNAITEVTNRGEQVILFNQRRGYSPYLICNSCGHVPKCLYCDISLTYHKHEHFTRCHYCGYTDHLTDQCSACSSFEMRREGVGTERLEEQLQEIFPKLRISRMDSDTTKSKNATRNLLNSFELKEIDVLVGTQMVTKGLDFDNVTLVAVVQADRLLNFPDFRAFETSFQLLTQFSGRAGRSAKQGRVLIQTQSPDHPVLQMLQSPYRDFYDLEIPNREWPNYPPYTRLIRVELRHTELPYLETQGKIIGDLVHARFGKLMIGPEFPPIVRLRNFFRLHILLKIPKKLSIKQAKDALKEEIRKYYQMAENKTLRVVIDVDPR